MSGPLECLQRERHAAAKEACRREVDRYAAKREGIEGAIASTEANIAQAEATLAEAQFLRTNLEKYEVMPLHTGGLVQLST